MTTVPASPEVELHGRLFERIDELEVENSVLRSSWLSVWQRLEAMRMASQVRRTRYMIGGFATGVVVALVLDGTIAALLS